MKRVPLILFFLSFIYTYATSLEESTSNSVIRSVRISRTHFNPSIGQSLDFAFEISQPGRIDVYVLDRDGFAIKKLADSKQVETGTVTLQWDGSDDTHVVPNEAYTFKIDWSSKEKKETYFPANKKQESIFLKATYYDRQRHLLLYSLTLPSRMHIHATSGKMNANGEFEGAVLKTLVDREPRVAGAVQEAWDGMDENGTIFVPDLLDFGISIAAEPLPENTVLTIGNKTRSFLSWAAQRKGQSFYGVQKKASGHHGLSVLEDISPKLKVNPEDAEWSNENRSWMVKESTVKVKGVLEGPSAESFAKYPGELRVFVDGKKIYATQKPVSPFTIDVPLQSSKKPIAVVFNWDTEYGPIAVAAFRLQQVLPQAANSSR